MDTIQSVNRSFRLGYLLFICTHISSAISADTLTFSSEWSATGVTSEQKRLEFNSLYTDVNNILLSGIPIPVDTYTVSENDFDGISGITLRNGLYAGGFPHELQQTFCILNSELCNEDEIQPLNVGDEIVLPAIPIIPSRSLGMYRKSADKTFEELVIESGGCDSWDQGCQQGVFDLNFRRIGLSKYEDSELPDDFEGDIIIPVQNYTAQITIQLDDEDPTHDALRRDALDPSIWDEAAETSDPETSGFGFLRGVINPASTPMLKSVEESIQSLNPQLIKRARTPATHQANITATIEAIDRSDKILEQVGHPKLEEELPWDKNRTVKIAVFDSWVDPEHCLFEFFSLDPNSSEFENDASITAIIKQENSQTDECIAELDEIDIDRDHGSHILSLIGRVLTSETQPSDFYTVHVKTRQITKRNFAQSLQNALVDLITSGHGTEVINLSMATNTGSNAQLYENDLLKNIKFAESKLFVLAAGNSGEEMTIARCVILPQCYAADPTVKNILNVAALDGNKLASWHENTGDPVPVSSNYGPLVHVAAPGMNVIGALYGNYIGKMSGTSQAAPLVAAAAALLIGELPKGMSSIDAKDRIIYSSDLLPELKQYNLLGGKLNIQRALSHRAYVKLGDRTLQGKIMHSQLGLSVEVSDIESATSCMIKLSNILRLSRLENADETETVAYEFFFKNSGEASVIWTPEEWGPGALDDCEEIYPENELVRLEVELGSTSRNLAIRFQQQGPDENEEGFTEFSLGEIVDYVKEFN